MNDGRLTPARGDEAAAHATNRDAAESLAKGVPLQIAAAGSAPLLRAPAADAEWGSELLFGERFIQYARDGAFVWGQSAHDGYMGWVRAEALSEPAPQTHKIAALQTYSFARPDVRSQPRLLLPLHSRVRVTDEDGRFSEIPPYGWVLRDALAPIEETVVDWVGVAERFLETPYLWGGRTRAGIDCSGLVQIALQSAGLAAPRDSHQQREALGVPLPIDFSALRRGDLVFWDGHVGLMCDAAHIVHANAHHMRTEIEPLRDAVVRIEAAGYGAVIAVKRLGPA